MKTYIGTKIIKAENATYGEFCIEKYGEYRPSEDKNKIRDNEGYKVQYSDNYTSWSPRPQFEEAYRPIDEGCMTFGLALEAMNKGKKVTLPHWSNDVFIKMNFPEKDNPYPSSSIKMTHKYMYVTSRYGTIPWIPTQIEILSEKWIIVE